MTRELVAYSFQPQVSLLVDFPLFAFQAPAGWQPEIMLCCSPVIDQQDLPILNEQSGSTNSVAHIKFYPRADAERLTLSKNARSSPCHTRNASGIRDCPQAVVGALN